MNILSGSMKEHPAQLVTAENQHEYQDAIPINPFYKPLLGVMFQASRLKQLNVVIVHDMAPEDAAKHSNMDVGVFDARFEGWTLTLNWTEEKRGKIHPDHIAVDFGGTSCGIISPYRTIRSCWNCDTTWKAKASTGSVSSHYDPHSGTWLSCACPTCHQPDWWAQTIEPSRLIADCAATIAEKTKKARLWKSFGGEGMDYQIAAEQAKQGAVEMTA